jgi:hypothetical protein
MRHDNIEAMVKTVLEGIQKQTEDQAREYFSTKLGYAVTTNDADALVFWSAVFAVWKNAPLTDATRYLSLSMAVQAPYIPKYDDDTPAFLFPDG